MAGSEIGRAESPLAVSIRRCPVEFNPLKEIMQEEGKNLSPSQIAKEMLQNCNVVRRKDFTVQPLVAGTGNGGQDSPVNRQKTSMTFKKAAMGGTKSTLSSVNNTVIDFYP